MAYTPGQPFSYGIPDGTYTGRPTTASCFEKDGRLILDVHFAVKDPQTGQYFKKDNGYDWEANKRHWLTSKDGAFNEATINGIKEWAKGWNPRSLDDFWWFQSPDANGTPFGNLLAIGEVELNFQIDKTGNQQLWVHDPNRQKAGTHKAYVPDGASADMASIKAKWATKAKALFAATPKAVSSTPAAAPAASAPAAPTVAAPARPTAPVRPSAPPAAKPWAEFPQTADGAFAFFSSKLGEPYSPAKHDERWFAIFDKVSDGKDPDQLTPADVQRLFEAVNCAFAG